MQFDLNKHNSIEHPNWFVGLIFQAYCTLRPSLGPFFIVNFKILVTSFVLQNVFNLYFSDLRCADQYTNLSKIISSCSSMK